MVSICQQDRGKFRRAGPKFRPVRVVNTSQLSERRSVANSHLEGLLDEHAVAKFYGVSVATVRRWRWLRTGPRFHKIGASVRYQVADLEAYLRRTPTGGEPAASEVG